MCRLIAAILCLTSAAVAQDCKIVADVTECRNGICQRVDWMGNGVYVAMNRDRNAALVLTAGHNVTISKTR